MRSRHAPRRCHSCQAPSGVGEDTCPHCGAEGAPGARLRLIEGGAASPTEPESTAGRLARLVAEARA